MCCQDTEQQDGTCVNAPKKYSFVHLDNMATSASISELNTVFFGHFDPGEKKSGSKYPKKQIGN